mmetsp:Transcript_25413/g.49658  ORF Transcript_25413/g.49658 Transcript_25413/m.49658 type:complete len:203 (+) Transcript_25413:157-765(+)
MVQGGKGKRKQKRKMRFSFLSFLLTCSCWFAKKSQIVGLPRGQKERKNFRSTQGRKLEKERQTDRQTDRPLRSNEQRGRKQWQGGKKGGKLLCLPMGQEGGREAALIGREVCLVMAVRQAGRWLGAFCISMSICVHFYFTSPLFSSSPLRDLKVISPFCSFLFCLFFSRTPLLSFSLSGRACMCVDFGSDCPMESILRLRFP